MFCFEVYSYMYLSVNRSGSACAESSTVMWVSWLAGALLSTDEPWPKLLTIYKNDCVIILHSVFNWYTGWEVTRHINSIQATKHEMKQVIIVQKEVIIVQKQVIIVQSFFIPSCHCVVDFTSRKVCQRDGDSCTCQHHKACVHHAGLWVHRLPVRAGKNSMGKNAW